MFRGIRHLHAAGLALGLGARLPARVIGAWGAGSGGSTAAAELSSPATEQGPLDLNSRPSPRNAAAGSNHVTIVMAQVSSHVSFRGMCLLSVSNTP